MKRAVGGLFVVVVSLAAIASADQSRQQREEAIQKDRERIEGTWRIVELVIDGNKADDEDAKKLTVVNGSDGTWTLRSEGNDIVKGTSIFDPTATPKTIDFTITDGESKDDKFVGIYELGEDARKLCFVPADRNRPTEFISEPGNQHFLVKFERVKNGE